DDHNGALPMADEHGDLAAAGCYAVRLHEENYWNDKLRVSCPANGNKKRMPPTPEQLAAAKTAGTFDALRCQMGGCYAYTLGYVENGQLHGLTRQCGGLTPLLADRPPRPDEVENWQTSNSLNHGGRGQNVLYVDGHVAYCGSRLIDCDDIFLNKAGCLAAGCSAHDIVLAPSEIPPVRAHRNDD